LAQLARAHPTGHRHHAGHHLFLADLVGNGEHRYLRHGVVRLEASLNSRGRDVLPRATEDVLLAVEEHEHAVRHLTHDIAGVEPATAPRLLGRLGILEIAGEETVARALWPAPAHQQLAFGAVGDLAITLADHHGLEPTERTPEGTGGD